MRFKFKRLGLSSGDIPIIVMNDDDAFQMGVNPGDRVRIFPLDADGHEVEPGVVAIVDYATGTGVVDRGYVGFYDEVAKKLGVDIGDQELEIQLSSKPKSFEAIKEKIAGKTLSAKEIETIITDCTQGNLLPIEIAAFLTGLEIRGATDAEVVNLTLAMAQSGEILDFGDDVYDKHSTGGVPGNKVSLVIVPIIAAAGLFIPKTSTRAITSPSGTADSMEVMAPVAFSKEEVVKIFKKERAAILWGGALDSAPADDVLIRIEKPLSMDPFPLMIASILCKKMAMGVKYLVLDVPCGKGTKFPTVSAGRKYATRFKQIGKEVGIKCTCLLTSASQPVGHAVGPALEAREALRLLIDPTAGPASLRNKSCELAGVLLEMAGKAPEGKGKDLALQILRDGEALQAMRQIISTQGGNPDVQPADVKVGPFVAEMRSDREGHVTSVKNKYINQIAKIAGCPAAKQAGVEIEKKIGASVKESDLLLRIYSDSELRLKEAVEFYNAHPPQVLGGMTLEKV